ncbi:allantoicase [Flagelloscypha sp. PMI_526]|nr:allantoicase [Flagelloscypha sp. PMI_526]
MSYDRVQVDDFNDFFGSSTELSSVAIGGEVKSVSDDFFASVHNLLLVEPAFSMKGQFGPNGALYSGWESRRHNAAYDWAIIKLGTAGTIIGFDIDTSHFNGNEGPEASVYALQAPPEENPSVEDPRWTELLPVVALGPTQRHLFKIPISEKVNFVKLNMIPDGGIARFRVYGNVVPVYPEDIREHFDLAHVFAGGRVEFTSDQHFGVGANLILPGRGKDMGDGWETKRSRVTGHKDWAIIKLGVPGRLQHVEIDTAHFKGNFPESCEMHAIKLPADVDWSQSGGEDLDWIPILPRTKMGPHRQHFFEVENVEGVVYSHVRVTIHPDGGIKRVRVIGTRADVDPVSGTDASIAESSATNVVSSSSSPPTNTKAIPVLPLTPEAFAPFGDVVQAYADHTAAPRGTKITPANQGSASKFHKLSLPQSSYPENTSASQGLSVYRCNPAAFIPMGKGAGDGLIDPAAAYLVVVAQNGTEDKPDMDSLRAFIASAAQGIVYKQGIWHQPMTVLHKALDLTCVETQIGDGSVADCEIVELSTAYPGLAWRLNVPRV